jgi:hypothetical protein
MGAARSSETSITIYLTRRRHIQEDFVAWTMTPGILTGKIEVLYIRRHETQEVNAFHFLIFLNILKRGTKEHIF